jgi:hypothetical protein
MTDASYEAKLQSESVMAVLPERSLVPSVAPFGWMVFQEVVE